MDTRSSSSDAARPRADLIDEDPRATLARVISAQEEGLRAHQVDLAEARNALASMQHWPARGDASEVARMTVEVAPSLVRNLLATTTGLVRNHVISPFVGAALDSDMRAFSQEVVSGGRPKRALYHASVLDDPRARGRLIEWAGKGEVQRIGSAIYSEFCVFGDAAVISVETWGDPQSDYVVMRDPMLVAAFTTLFDLAWEEAYPPPTARGDDTDGDDAALLDLLGRGLKDEAIARYLGWSLRTVRRRVARLMEELGARTRFQLGAEAVRAGRVETSGPATPASPPAYPGQLGPRSGSR